MLCYERRLAVADPPEAPTARAGPDGVLNIWRGIGPCGQAPLLAMSLVALAPPGLLGTIYQETFANAPEASLAADARYTDPDGHKCAHMLEPSSLENQRSICSKHSEEPTGPTILGYDAFYVDTLGADGTAAMHTEAGAKVGVVALGPSQRSTDGFVFELEASGIDGLTIVCSHPFTPDAPTPIVASTRVYISPKGWHEAADELRVWAEVGEAAPDVWQVSLLPECTPAATRESIDRRVSALEQLLSASP